MTNDEGRKPEGAPERSPKAGGGAPSGVDGSGGTLKFLRIVGKKGEAPVANVEFEYEVVPNVWTHVQKRLPTDTLAAERRTSTVGLQKISEQWRLIHEPAL